MTKPLSRPRRLPLIWCLAVLVLATAAEAQNGLVPSFSKSFQPSTIGPGSVSTLTFDIFNEDSTPVSDLAFTDNLPAAVAIATPAQATSTCGGTLSAPDGGGTITLSGGGLGASSGCAITVDVTSAIPGLHTNTSGDLTSSAGNSGTATADLTVATDRPGFTKSFSPNPISLGGRSTLTFTIDNSANGAAISNISFADNLPTGLVVADPANASTTCSGGVITAAPGTGVISYGPAFFGDASLGAGSTCTVGADVTATGAGFLGNTTEELTFTSGLTTLTAGKASAVLEVTADTLSLSKSFTDDPVPPGATVTLEFNINNLDRSGSASGINFTDDLDAALSGLVATGLPLANPCGSGSSLSGAGLLTLTGANLPPEGSCTFSVSLQVPAAATPGVYTNTTSSITGDVGGESVSGSPATELLFVEVAPLLTKSFTDDPVAGGDSVTLEFTITNTDTTSSATDIAFTDELTTIIPGLTSSSLPADGFCGPGSSITEVTLSFEIQGLSMTGGSLGAGASCTFDVILDVPAAAPTGTYTNTTSPISATVADEPLVGDPASDDLLVLAAPVLTKSFTDDPVAPGGTVTLEFTLDYPPDAPADATAIAFSDDLNAALAGLAATGLPMNDVCGTGSQIAGTTNLSFSGGSLAPGSSCTFGVTLQVPADALAGNYTNTTSAVSATVLGEAVVENPASDLLEVAGLTLTKSFTDDPAVPGGSVTLELTLQNLSPVSDATDIAFTDDLDAVLSGLASSSGTLSNICGSGSQISGTNVLSFTGGNLAAASSCTFSVTLQVPAAASPGEYTNATSTVTATIDAMPVTLPGATDSLTVTDALTISKSFTDDPVASGGTVTLEFTLTNAHPTENATGISFTDDLDAALSGLASSSGTLSDICGSGSQISGTNVLSFTGGTLAAASSCTFSVTLQVPAGVPFGTTVVNTTSQVTGTIEGNTVTGDPATDDLQIENFVFTKSFGGVAISGGSATLTFTIENLNASAAVTGVSFVDDLDAVVPGLVAVGLPMSDVCGPGSQLAGTSILSLTDASLGPGGSCTFGVTLQVPATAPAGSFTNTTSQILVNGIAAGSSASAALTVIASVLAIPTVTTWGLILLSLLILAAAVRLLRC